MPRSPTVELPKELAKINPSILRQVLPNLKLTVEPHIPGSDCHKVTFTVAYSPGLLFGNEPGYIRPLVRITDLSEPDKYQDLYPVLPRSGGSTKITYEFPLPADAQFRPDFDNEIKVEVDPDNHYAERNENDNVVTFFGHCVG
jgi:hypothetical protein